MACAARCIELARYRACRLDRVFAQWPAHIRAGGWRGESSADFLGRGFDPLFAPLNSAGWRIRAGLSPDFCATCVSHRANRDDSPLCCACLPHCWLLEVYAVYEGAVLGAFAHCRHVALQRAAWPTVGVCCWGFVNADRASHHSGPPPQRDSARCPGTDALITSPVDLILSSLISRSRSFSEPYGSCSLLPGFLRHAWIWMWAVPQDTVPPSASPPGSGILDLVSGALRW